MKSLRIHRCLCVAALTIGLTTASASAFSTIVWGTPGVYDPFDPCPGPDTPGGTSVRPLAYLPMPGASFIEALEWQFSGPNRYTADGVKYRPPEERWTFDWGGPLYGALFIDIYDAYDRHHGFDAGGNIVWDSAGDWCRHGVHLSASYARDPTHDPPLELLDWVQVFVASYDKHGVPAGTPLVDPFFDDGTDDAPMYFSNLDDPHDFYLGANPLADLIFGDTPGASHLETGSFYVSLDLELFLASRDPFDPHHLFIHDGISWGYEGYCTIPAPASVVLVLIGCQVVAVLRRRKTSL